MRFIKSFLYIALAIYMVGCGSSSSPIASVESIQSTPQIPVPSDTSDAILKKWPHQDLLVTGFPGISLDKAYAILKGKKSTRVIVAVIDSGIDIHHEDLKDVIWTNPKEIPNNGIDDDRNGYVDDIHGWNFLGNIEGENMEFVRVILKGDTSSPEYQKALAKYEEEWQETQKGISRMQMLLERIQMTDDMLKQMTGKQAYQKQDIEKLNLQDPIITAAIMEIFDKYGSFDKAKESLQKGEKYYQNKLKYYLNKDLNARQVLGDNPYDINDRNYGDNNVVGPTLDGAFHGTHMAGIIGATRNNGIGMDGVADNVSIMAIRAVPDGDEYDKDIALAIRYAVDNGAKVINTSFGKGFSPNAQWVYEAIQYAASKDVLIVNAAGNDTKDIDTHITYPDDNINGVEFANNLISIGALNFEYNQKLPADFSNYGKQNVDVFAPGVKIYSTTPVSKYDFAQGTSMAAPEVAGIASMIRSYFPDLKASEVKEILMDSGIKPHFTEVFVGHNPEDKRSFDTLSKSGKFVNAYNAVILAMKRSKK